MDQACENGGYEPLAAVDLAPGFRRAVHTDDRAALPDSLLRTWRHHGGCMSAATGTLRNARTRPTAP